MPEPSFVTPITATTAHVASMSDAIDPYLSPEETAAYPMVGPQAGRQTLASAQRRMAAAGQWHPAQLAGRRWPIGCVALEVTQRCNLDCSICYLSDNAEAVHDLPLAELRRRIDGIVALYGPGTNLQITGGEPTLRNRDELTAIVAYAADCGLRPTLFTNGIKASRPLLAQLAAVGLADVAFHVDLTQNRKGYRSETALNAVRRQLIEAARGLGLAVYFNTTVFSGNAAEVPALVRFFLAQADAVNLASFQLQADTGRGVDRRRPGALTVEGVEEAMNTAAGGALRFGQLQPGHARCNRYAAALVCNGRAYPLAEDNALVAEMLAATRDLSLDRGSPAGSVRRALGWLLRHPRYAGRAAGWAIGRALAMRGDLIPARGRVHKLSFMIHNFMDACRLERARVDACIFHTATADGTVSMCLHNARRDALTLAPIRLDGGYWDPLTGRQGPDPVPDRAVRHSRKTLKGKLKRARSDRGRERTNGHAAETGEDLS